MFILVMFSLLACIVGGVIGSQYFGPAVTIGKAKEELQPIPTVQASHPTTITLSSTTLQAIIADQQAHDERMMMNSLETIETVVVSADRSQGFSAIAQAVEGTFTAIGIIALSMLVIYVVAKRAGRSEGNA
jgi:hypothetical protein